MGKGNKTWHSYAQFFSIDNPSALRAVRGMISIEEKINGRWMAVQLNPEGELVFYPPPSEEMHARFQGIQHQLVPGQVYWFETVEAQKEDILTYTQLPQGNAVLIDVRKPDGELMGHEEKFRTADELGFTCAPMLHQGYIESAEQLLQLLQMESVLGGDMEGVIIKPETPAGTDGKIRFIKFQREGFLVQTIFRPAMELEGNGPTMRDIEQMLRAGRGRQLTGPFHGSIDDVMDAEVVEADHDPTR